MLDLSAVSGLPIKFDPATSFFTASGKMKDPLYGTREIPELGPVAAEPDEVYPGLAYWMYRNTGLKGDEALLTKHRLRFDITVFSPGSIGREIIKTSGHYHPPVWEGGPVYPEVYEVLYGEATYLLQKVDNYLAGPDEVKVQDAIVMVVKAGQKAIMPPDYGHVTINAGSEPLVMCNWVSDDFSSYYQSAEACRGFGYYYVSQHAEPEDVRMWVPNPTYRQELPPLRRAEPVSVPELGLIEGVPMYQTCRENPQYFAWLQRPQDYEELLWRGLRILEG